MSVASETGPAPAPPAGPPRFRDAREGPRLRDRLAEAGFTDGGILEVLGVSPLADLKDPEVLRARTAGGSPLEALIRLFLMGMTVPATRVEAALAPVPLRAWEEVGLVRSSGGECSSPVELLPYKGLWLAFDRVEAARVAHASDYVMGIGSSTLTLENLLVPCPEGTVLDLGCGCGTLGLRASSSARRVVLADRSRRAVAFAAFNRALNGARGCACLVADRFAPLAPERFDLIVSNPPFVVSPSSRFVFRDGGMRGDGMVQTLLREAPARLREGGYCQMLVNWAHLRGVPWEERLAGWLAGSGCDAWVVRSETRDPATYASTWLRHTEGDADPAQLAARHREWVRYYEAEGIEALSAGFVVLRRRGGGATWFRTDSAPPRMLGPCGEEVVRRFEVETFLATLPEGEAGERRLRALAPAVPPAVRLEQTLEPGEGGWRPITGRLRRDAGFAHEAAVDGMVAELVGACDGRRSVGDLVDALARRGGADPTALWSAASPILRDLLRHGFLGLAAA